VDPDVTGTPVITYESIRRMEAAYTRGAVYALVVVGLITLLVIRRLRETRWPSRRWCSGCCGPSVSCRCSA